MAENTSQQNLTKEEQRIQDEALFAERVQAYTGSRARLIMVLLRSRLMLLAKTNLMLVVFALPAIAALVVFSMMRGTIEGAQPWSAHIGLGIMPFYNIAGDVAFNLFVQDFWGIIAVTAGIPIFMLGLCGAMYVMKFVARGQNVKVLNTFAMGIKKCVLPFLVAAPILSGLFFVIAAGSLGFDFYMEGQDGAKIAILVVAGILSLIVVFMLYFYMTMGVTYKMNPLQILVNSLKIVFMPKLIWRHFVITLITIGPLVGIGFLSLTGIGFVIGLMFTALILLGFVMLVWTVYADWVYKRVYAPTVAKRNPTVSTSQEKEEYKTVEVTFKSDSDDAVQDSSSHLDATEVADSEVEELAYETNIDDNTEQEKNADFDDLGDLETEGEGSNNKPHHSDNKKAKLKVKK